jgi:methylglutaconyl-CoA hydratase
MAYETIILDIDGRGVATLTLNRPDLHNAFNEVLIGELHDAVNGLNANKDARVIVLCGAGQSFSAGADLNWMKKAAGYSIAENEADAMRLSDMLQALNSVPKPVVALVQGAAFGGGVGLVACADIVIAVKSAKFALTEVRLGLIPATIAPFVLAAIGRRQARRFFLTGERFGGVTAREIGLVHEVADDETALAARAGEIIEALLAGGPQAVNAAKKLIFAVAGREVTEDLRRNTAERIAARRDSEEGRQGITAFLEKREPDWPGNNDK